MLEVGGALVAAVVAAAAAVAAAAVAGGVAAIHTIRTRYTYTTEIFIYTSDDQCGQYEHYANSDQYDQHDQGGHIYQ